MTLQECINAIDSAKINKYTTAQKIEWLSFLEYTIINDVLKTHEGYNGEYDDFNGYTEDDMGVTLIIQSPFESLYVDYLEMRIDEANGETSLYNASASQYNAKLLEYKKYYNKTHMPLSVTKSSPNSNNKQDISLSQDDINTIATMVYSRLLPEVGTKIETEVENSLSDTNIYTVVTDYMSRNGSNFRGKDGKDGKDGEPGADGKPFTYADLTSEEKAELSGNARLAEAWAIGSPEFGETLSNNSKYYAKKSSEYTEQGEAIRRDILNAQTTVSRYTADALRYSNEASDMAALAESFAVGGTGTRDDEVEDNAAYYSDKAKEYAQASQYDANKSKKYSEDAKKFADEISRITGNVSGINAIRLDYISDKYNDLTVNTNAVKSYGKNLVDYSTPIYNATAFPLGEISFPVTVSVSIDTTKGFGTVQLRRNKTADEGGGVERFTFASNSTVSYTSFVIDGTNRKFGEYEISTSTSTQNGAVKRIQVELGTKETYYEAYKPPVSGAVAMSPTTTLIADVEGTELTATYSKDVTLVITELEKQIEHLESVISNS